MVINLHTIKQKRIEINKSYKILELFIYIRTYNELIEKTVYFFELKRIITTYSKKIFFFYNFFVTLIRLDYKKNIYQSISFSLMYIFHSSVCAIRLVSSHVSYKSPVWGSIDFHCTSAIKELSFVFSTSKIWMSINSPDDNI